MASRPDRIGGPHSGRPGRIRELALPRTLFLVPYRLDGDTVQVLWIFDRAPLARELLRRRASLVCETICGTSTTRASPSRQQALVLSPNLTVTRLKLCAAVRSAGNNARIHCLQPLNSCLPSTGCRLPSAPTTASLRANWRPADQTAGATGSPLTADSVATIPSWQQRANSGNRFG
jgi:hypothetical protein